MSGIRGADVDRVDGCVLEQLAIVVDRGFYTESRCEPFCWGKFAAGDRGYVDELHSPQGFQMHAAHKSGSDDCCSNPSHLYPYSRKCLSSTPTTLWWAAL